MARPGGWDILGLDGDPTPGVVESVQALAKQFQDFADDAERAWHALNSFGGDAAALQWVGQTADAFNDNFGPLPGRMQKLYTSYREAGDALAAYAPKLQTAQSKADTALRQALDAHADLQRATTAANSAATDLKTARQNQAAAPNPQAVTDAQTAHDTAQKNLTAAKAQLDALSKTAHEAYNDRIAAAKECARALHQAQSDGIHNKHWWEHIGEILSEWGGKIAEIAGDLAPFLDVLALATSWIPGVDVVTAALAEADNLIALAGTALKIVGDGMQGHWGDALLGAGMLGAQFLGGKALEKFGGPLLEKIGARGNKLACEGGDPVDVVSGHMIAYETDLALPGTLPLVLRRAYSSAYGAGRLLGPGWSSSLDQRLSVNAAGIHFAGDDAQVLNYPTPAAGQTVFPAEGARWPLEWDQDTDEIRISDPAAGYTWRFGTVHYREDHGQIRDLTTITDRHGNRIDIRRDEHGTPTLVEHHGGYAVAVDTTATAAGIRVSGLRLLDDSAPEGRVRIMEYRYDERGRLRGVVNSSGLAYTYEYDDENRITATTDRVGFRYAYEYDAYGRVVRGTGTEGFLSAAFSYDEDANTTVVTDSLGHASRFGYDDYGHLVAFTDPLGNTVLTEYDRYGRLLSRTDALGNRTEYTRDEHGDPIRITAADGGVTAFEYNAFHQVTSVQTADGPTWRRRYDDRGNLVEVVEPTGAVTRAEYAANGCILRGIDPMGSIVQFECNAAGLPVVVTDPLGGTTRAMRDAFGRVVAVTDPAGATTRFDWTVEGLLATRIDPTGARTQWEYDAEGNLTATIDPLGATSMTEVGPFGRALARTGPDGVRHEFLHDTELNLLAVATSAGGTWRYLYDRAGRLIGETDFIGRELAYEYDAAGRMVARSAGLDEQIRFDYDAVGRMVQRHTPEGDFHYAYDSENQIAQISGPDSTVEYRWDDSGRLAAETVDGRTTAYEYDLAGRRVRRITPSGAVSDWTYDAAGLPASLQAGSARLAFGFDAAGREIERFLPGGTLNLELDVDGRLAAQQLWAGDDAARTRVLERQWSWRADGIPSEIRDSLRGPRRYETDPVGRVTAVSAQGRRETYAYDAFGNVNIPDGGAAEPGVADTPRTAERTQIRRARRTSYEYDGAGRVVRTVRRTLDGRRLVREFTWNSEDRLIRTVTPDGAVWHYSYDPLGRRTAKTRMSADGTVAERTIFIWEGPVLAEQRTYPEDGPAIAVTWDYDPGTVKPAAQRHRTLAGDAEPAGDDEAFYAIVTDLVGTPTELVAEDGSVAWYTTTDLWGRTVVTSGEHDADCPLRFPGQYFDAETGLNYNLHRYYDPESGSYLTPDPLGLAASPNDHAYVPNPLTDTDPFGLMCDRALMNWADEAAGKASNYHEITNRPGDVASQWFYKNGTTSVVRARFPDGDGGWVVKDVVAQSGKEMDVSVVSAAMKNGDIPVPQNFANMTHAEHNALMFISQVGGVPVAGGASRSVCNTVCGPFIRATEGRISGQVYSRERGTKVRTFYWPGSMTF